jgi:hypothetical protein
MTGDCDSLGTTRADRTLASLTLTAALIAAFGFSVDARAPGCVQPLPNGFHQLKDAGLRDPWDKPWALRRTPSGTSSLPVLRHSSRDAARPMPLRLDDGTTGTLVVVAKDCQLGGDCSPYDCGCTGPTESYWIEVHRADGTVIARRHLWAAPIEASQERSTSVPTSVSSKAATPWQQRTRHVSRSSDSPIHSASIAQPVVTCSGGLRPRHSPQSKCTYRQGIGGKHGL